MYYLSLQYLFSKILNILYLGYIFVLFILNYIVYLYVFLLYYN